jgi:hypothetical protein
MKEDSDLIEERRRQDAEELAARTRRDAEPI